MGFRPIARIITILGGRIVVTEGLCGQATNNGARHLSHGESRPCVYNMQVDDVRAPKRQQELAELTDVLAKFQPTKIAIEADPESQRIPAAYQVAATCVKPDQ